MKRIQRTKGIRKIIRTVILRKSIQKYITTGNRACGNMMRETRRRPQKPGPSDSAIMAWARFDLSREIIGGFREIRTA